MNSIVQNLHYQTESGEDASGEIMCSVTLNIRPTNVIRQIFDFPEKKFFLDFFGPSSNINNC